MLRTAAHKHVFRLYERDELYALARDPGEQRNLVDDPSQATVLADLRWWLLARMVESADIVPHHLDPR